MFKLKANLLHLNNWHASYRRPFRCILCEEFVQNPSEGLLRESARLKMTLRYMNRKTKNFYLLHLYSLSENIQKNESLKKKKKICA